MPTLTETLDNLYTTTWQNMKEEAGDEVFAATPFWYWLKENGGLESTAGGRFMTEPLRYAKHDVFYIGKGESVPLADKEFLTVAKEDWKYQVGVLTRFGVDDQQNRGKNAIMSLMTAKMSNVKDSLADDLETTLAGLNRVAAPKKFLGLQDLVADAPAVTAATLHGIDPSVDAWWRNQALDYQNTAGAIDVSATLVNQMNKMINLCSNNKRLEAPDIILSGKEPFEMYWELTLEQRRVVNEKLGDAGFQNVEFRGIPMVWVPAVNGVISAVAPARMYFINSRRMKFKYDPMAYFDMTEWKAIPGQVNDRTSQIVTAGNMMVNSRRVHGVFWNMQTP